MVWWEGHLSERPMILAPTAPFFASPKLRRVRKEQGVALVVSKPDGLDLCLDLWIEWMRKVDTDLGIKSGAMLSGDGDGSGNADAAQTRRDNEIAAATDAMISSLQRSHQWAIRRKCGISRGSVWNFPNLDYMAEAADACVALEQKLRANIATRLLW